MTQIEHAVRSVTDGRRASYLFDTRIASEAVGCHPNKFNDWWVRTHGKLLALYQSQPGELAAELMGIIALAAEAERQRRQP